METLLADMVADQRLRTASQSGQRASRAGCSASEVRGEMRSSERSEEIGRAHV